MHCDGRSCGRGVCGGLTTLLLAVSEPADAGDPEVCRAPWGTGPIRVACLGDSNTASGWQIGQPDGFPQEDGWCERLADEVLSSTNCGWGSATASPNTTGLPFFQGAGQLETALDDPATDVVILAFGTNDVGALLNNPDRLLLEDPTPAGVADVIEGLVAEAESAGAAVLVATTPYRELPTDPARAPPPAGRNDLADELNDELAQRFGASMRVDFTHSFTTSDYLSDGLHVSASGMAKRAYRARRAVLRVLPEPDDDRALPVLLALLALQRSWQAVSRAGASGARRRPRR